MTARSGGRTTLAVVIWIILAICAGVWLGVAARIAMRLIALEAGLPGGFSSGGSLEVILFGAIFGVPVALVVWACRGKWRLPFWFGTIVSVVLFFLLAMFQPSAARSALAGTPDQPLWTSILFAAAFVSYGALLDAIWAWKKPPR